jgi:hypothetical protein
MQEFMLNLEEFIYRFEGVAGGQLVHVGQGHPKGGQEPLLIVVEGLLIHREGVTHSVHRSGRWALLAAVVLKTFIVYF